jgi:hypothetical protein
MAERHPGWVNGIDAFEARLATGLSVMAQGTGDALDPLRVRAGIRDAPGDPGLVTLGQNKVTVNPFQAVIADAARPAGGPYLVTSDAVKELPLGPAHASLSRIDLVIAEVNPGSGTGFEVKVYVGENSSTPQRPTVSNPNNLELAEIRIPPAGTTPSLTDKRRFTAALNGILPVRSAGDRPPITHVPYSMFIYRIDTGVLEVQAGAEWVPYRPPRGDGWHAPTLQNNWRNYENGYVPAGYTLSDDGWVRLRGFVTGGTVTVVKACFTLPAGYRPKYIHVLPVPTWSAPVTNNTLAASRVDITPKGDVIPLSVTSGWISLDGIQFPTWT